MAFSVNNDHHRTAARADSHSCADGNLSCGEMECCAGGGPDFWSHVNGIDDSIQLLIVQMACTIISFSLPVNVTVPDQPIIIHRPLTSLS